jgi:uncharacterized coiled-coil DUF342 family protein
MKKSLTALFTGLFILSFLSGCTGAPSTDHLSSSDQDLLRIQQETTEKINEFAQKMDKAELEFNEVQKTTAEIDNFVSKQIKEIKGLANKAENTKIAEETKANLEAAGRLIGKLKEVADKMQAIGNDAENVSELEELKKSFNGYKSRLNYYTDKFKQLSDQLLNPPSKQ